MFGELPTDLLSTIPVCRDITYYKSNVSHAYGTIGSLVMVDRLLTWVLCLATNTHLYS